jgi:pantoate--beta-alanine ligase
MNEAAPAMPQIEAVAEMRRLAAELRQRGGGALALVSTRGALHAGHEAIIRAAVADGAPVVVSIFVNPLAFGPSENFAGYPRRLERDLALCRELGVAAVFTPAAEAIYPRGYSTYVMEEFVSKPLAGLSRPAHFRGVTTWAVKLLNVVGPTRWYLGQKDGQEVAVLRKLAADLDYAVDWVVVPTVREADGLAANVRNADLSAGQRQDAIALSHALAKVKEMVDSGVRSTDRAVAEATHILSQRRRLRVIHAAIVDATTMEAVREIVPGRSLMVIAVWVDEIRLTDNALL